MPTARPVRCPNSVRYSTAAGTKYDVVTGYLDDAQAWAEIYGWIDAAKVACGMRRNRMGLLGNYYGGMVDVYSDLRLQSTVFGTHAEILEMCELHEFRRSVTQREADARVAAFGEAFVVDGGCTPEELERAARTSVALDKLAEAHRLGSLAYYYAGRRATPTKTSSRRSSPATRC